MISIAGSKAREAQCGDKPMVINSFTIVSTYDLSVKNCGGLHCRILRQIGSDNIYHHWVFTHYAMHLLTGGDEKFHRQVGGR
jgi:hypothetical protein